MQLNSTNPSALDPRGASEEAVRRRTKPTPELLRQVPKALGGGVWRQVLDLLLLQQFGKDVPPRNRAEALGGGAGLVADTAQAQLAHAIDDTSELLSFSSEDVDEARAPQRVAEDCRLCADALEHCPSLIDITHLGDPHRKLFRQATQVRNLGTLAGDAQRVENLLLLPVVPTILLTRRVIQESMDANPDDGLPRCESILDKDISLSAQEL